MSELQWKNARTGLWRLCELDGTETGWRIEVAPYGKFQAFAPGTLYVSDTFPLFTDAKTYCEKEYAQSHPQPQAIPRRPASLTESDFRITPICDRTEYACWRGGHYTTHPNVFEAVDYARSLVATRRCEITAWEDQYGNLVEWCKEGTDYVYEPKP